MSECIFCKIVKEDLSCFKIYEDKNVLAFLDMNPIHPGHVLVIPKKHSETILDTDDDVLKDLIVITKKISKAVYEGLNLEGFNVSMNQFEVGNQAVPHLHIHIIPRHKDDGLRFWPQREYESEEKKKEVQEKITRLLK